MRLSGVPAAGALSGADITYLTQGGLDRRSTLQAMRNFPESKAANMASAATLNLASATGPYVSVTGTTTITALGTVQAGAEFVLHFQGALTLTHNATSLILPTSANIVTAAGDTATFRSEGSGNWRCVGYRRANGMPLAVDTDGTLAANSDTKVPTQKAVKTYVDGIVAAMDAMVFKGVIDCSANPNYPAADRGWTYRVSVAGKIGGASGVDVEAGDILICLTDGTAAGDQATVGAQWSVIQTNIDGALIDTDIGVTVQAWSAILDALAALSYAADKMIYATGTGSFALTDLTAFARSCLAAADADALRSLIAAASAKGVPVITDATNARSMAPSDTGNYIRFTATGAKTVTFDDADGFAADEEYHITNRAASDNLTLTPAGTMTLNPPKGGSLVLEPGDTVTVKMVSGTEADVMGTTEAA